VLASSAMAPLAFSIRFLRRSSASFGRSTSSMFISQYSSGATEDWRSPRRSLAALAEAKERQDGKNHHNQSDQIDDAVHGRFFPIAVRTNGVLGKLFRLSRWEPARDDAVLFARFRAGKDNAA